MGPSLRWDDVMVGVWLSQKSLDSRLRGALNSRMAAHDEIKTRGRSAAHVEPALCQERTDLPDPQQVEIAGYRVLQAGRAQAETQSVRIVHAGHHAVQYA